MNLIIESIGRTIEPDLSKTSVVHVRNSIILADIIEADLVACPSDLPVTVGKKYKNIICCYASPYMKYKQFIDVLRDNPQAKLWWFVNDHDLEDNILLRNIIMETEGRRKINMICNNPREGYRGWILRKKIRNSYGNQIGILDDFIDEWHTMNLNALIFNYLAPYDFDDKTNEKNLFGDDLYESIYYGTMRKWRLHDMLEYQNANITFSATPRTQKKLIEHGCLNYAYTDKLSWQKGVEDLNKYKFSLYIEDEHTHDNYAHMANRFYEALMFNVVTIFDSKCRKTIERSQFDIDEKYIVDGAEEYKRAVDHLQSKDDFEAALIDNEEHKEIARNENIEVTEKLRNLL